MYKKLILLCGIGLVSHLSGVAVAGAYSGGTGTAEDPYQITTAEDWQELIATSSDWDRHFVLTTDLDLQGVLLAPIGRIDHPFAGVFDGNGHLVHRPSIDLPDADFVGLFGCVGADGWIRNLNLENVDIRGRDIVGGLVGTHGRPDHAGGTISDCQVTGIVAGRAQTGGLVGENRGTVSNCLTTVSVTGTSDVGGLIGQDLYGTIAGCRATGTTSGTGWRVGGLVGKTEGGLLDSCHARGIVSGTNAVGGLVGQAHVGWVAGELYGAMLTSCHAAATVIGTQQSIGGLVGESWGASITSCHAAGTVDGTGEESSFVGGLVGYASGFSQVSRCYATSPVSGICEAGGLIGRNEGGIVTSCYARGPVTGWSSVGGLLGFQGQVPTVSFCYATGAVSGLAIGGCVGGLVGDGYGEDMGDCFWDVDSSGQADSAGGIGFPTSKMKTRSIFTKAGWDFVGDGDNGTQDAWRMCADGVDYPRLAWEFAQAGDLDCPDGVALEDLTFLAGRWLVVYPDALGRADANADGIVDQQDLAILAEHWLAGM